MRVLILFHSRSGNTEKLARAVADGVAQVPGADAVLRRAEQATPEELAGANAVIAGCPVYAGSMSAELKAVFDRCAAVRARMEGKPGAAFATGGDPSGGKELALLSIHAAMLVYGMVVVGDPLSASGHFGVACLGAPDATALDHGRKLGRRVAELAGALRAGAVRPAA